MRIFAQETKSPHRFALRIPVQGRMNNLKLLGSVFYGFSLCYSNLDNLSDEAPRAFHESKFIGKAAFEQDPDAMVSRHIGCRNQHDIFSNTEDASGAPVLSGRIGA